jgi:thymidylate kinase
MEFIAQAFENIGYPFSSPEDKSSGLRVDVFYIRNADGSIRWVWPAHLKEPLVLKFYSIQGWRSILFSMVLRWVFLLRLQRFVFSRATLIVNRTENPDFMIEGKWALFTGTMGPNRKAVIYTETDTTPIFIKIPLGKNSIELVKNECDNLLKLSALNPSAFIFPKVIFHSDKAVAITDISDSGKRSTLLTDNHCKAIQAMSLIDRKDIILRDVPAWKQALQYFETYKENHDSRLPAGLIRKVEQLIQSIDDSKVVTTGLVHGDFTPWNLFIKNGELRIYDWELSDAGCPLGYDAFHFIFQQAILVDRVSWTDIEKRIQQAYQEGLLKQVLPIDNDNWQDYLNYYLVIHVLTHIDLYSKQEHWHTQVLWLFRTWSEALTSSLQKVVSHRKLLIIDLFDDLQNKSYAALKFTDGLPENHDAYSDIDLCMSQETASGLLNALKKHILVSNIICRKKSFMYACEIVCLDGSSLHVDLIWNIKYKNYQMLSIEDMLQNNSISPYGVKLASISMNARYIALFYALNHAEIPAKYLHYLNSLKESKHELDVLLLQYSEGGDCGNKIKQLVYSTKENRGYRWLVNTVRYFLDTCRSFLGRSGCVITFSGVDGAGKSTVIEIIKQQIDKQVRTKVIVLRHRPSLLPILSVWTKGREVAEREAALSLPHTGVNQNVLSSLIRFTYYYADYLIGQFAIYLKYVRRGYVVLYDRYYFDFINDAKRSNIQLSRKLTKACYRFLLQPDLNFFLYADPAVILNRKKELDAVTIKELTNNYLQLFDEFNNRNTHQRYYPIENVDLETTIPYIMTVIKRRNDHDKKNH